MQGFNRQRNLQAVPKDLTKTETFPLNRPRSDSSDEGLPGLDWYTMIGGIADEAEKEMKMKQAKADIAKEKTSNHGSADANPLSAGATPQVDESRHGSADTREEIGASAHKLQTDVPDLTNQHGEEVESEEPDIDEDEHLNSGPSDPETRKQFLKMQDLKLSLQRQNALHRQERERSITYAMRGYVPGPQSSDFDTSHDSIRISEQPQQVQQTSGGSQSINLYSGTTKVPSTHLSGPAGTQTLLESSESLDQPSTITHVSLHSNSGLSKYHPDSSSSYLPYSSPLGREPRVTASRRQFIHHPSPRRIPQEGADRVEKLENMVEWDRRRVTQPPPFVAHHDRPLENEHESGGTRFSRHLDRAPYARMSDDFAGDPHNSSAVKTLIRGPHAYSANATINPIYAGGGDDEYHGLRESPTLGQKTTPRKFNSFRPVPFFLRLGHQLSKRVLSPDTPPPVVVKRHRPVRGSSSKGIAHRNSYASPTWSTLRNPSKPPIPPTGSVRQSGTFRLPLARIFQHSGKTASAPSSTTSQRVNWFKPPPLQQQHESIVQDYVPGDRHATGSNMRTQESFDSRPGLILPDARNGSRVGTANESARFHDQIRGSLGSTGSQSSSSIDRQHTDSQGYEWGSKQEQEDWRSAWAKQPMRGAGSSLDKYVYSKQRRSTG